MERADKPSLINWLSRVESEPLKEHLEHCVAGATVSGDPAERDQKTAEPVDLIDKLRS